MKYVFSAVVALIIARGIVGLISPKALNAPPLPEPVKPFAPVMAGGQVGTISGSVSWAKNGEPLVGASVVVEGTELGAATDVRGQYLIIHVPPGMHRLTASYVGFRDLSAAVTLDSLTGQRVDFHLTAAIIHRGEVE